MGSVGRGCLCSDEGKGERREEEGAHGCAPFFWGFAKRSIISNFLHSQKI